jgi:ABC-2 type transport system permease protein
MSTSHASLLSQIRLVAWRAVMRTLRQPAQIVPPIAFPLTLLAVNAAGLDAATDIPGFPADSYIDFAIAIAFLQGSLFAMINAGSDLARDVETGFLKRLALTPVKRAALLVGQLAGVLLVSFVSGIVYLIVGLIAGVTIESGIGGVAVLFLLTMLIVLAFASIGALVGLRSGSGEAVQGFFPLFFVLLFLSSMNLPRNLIEHDWFRTIATWNPVSYLIEGIRSLFITGWDGEALALGFGLAAVIAAVGIAGSTAALRERLVRT